MEDEIATGNLTRRAALAIGGATLAGRAWAQPSSPPGVAPKLRRGINLHGLLNWPEMRKTGSGIDYVWPPFTSPVYQIGDAELRRLSTIGFDFARVTIDPSIVIMSTGDRWEQLVTIIRERLHRILGAGFAVVVDLHPVAVNPEFKPTALVDPASREAFARYAEAVGRMAVALSGEAPNRVAFELMNEPWIERVEDTPRWLPMQEELHRRARAGAPGLPLVLTGVQWGSIGALLRVDTAPYRSSNVLYTFHYYDPHPFTHQGVGHETPFLSGVSWPPSRENTDAVLAKVQSRIEASSLAPADRVKTVGQYRTLLDNMIRQGHGRERMTREFDSVVQWGAGNGVGPERMFLGEFGCVNVAAGEPVDPSRLTWLTAVRSAAEQRGLGWAYWAYKGYGGMELVSKGGAFDTATASALGLKPS